MSERNPGSAPWSAALPTEDVLRRARLGCGWVVVAGGRFWRWTGRVGDAFWCLYVSRLTGRWTGEAFRLEA